MKSEILVVEHKIPVRLRKRGYDTYRPEAGTFCKNCGAYSPMTHTLKCPKIGVKKSAVAGGVAW